MDTLSEAFKHYSRKPSHFVYPVILQWIFTFLVIGAVSSIVLIINGLFLSELEQIYIIAVISISVLIMLVVFAGFKAGLYRGFYTAYHGYREKLDEFCEYSMKTSITFVLISLIKMLIFSITLIPVIAAYVYSPDLFNNQIVIAGVGIIYLFIYWILNYMFKMSQLLVVIKKYGARQIINAINESVWLSIKKFFIFFPLYFVESFVIAIGLIPILNLISGFALYPISITAYYIAYEKAKGQKPEGRTHKKKHKKYRR